jgi:hypothetical protein
MQDRYTKTNPFVQNFAGSKQSEEHSYKTWQDRKRCGLLKKDRREGRASDCTGRESGNKTVRMLAETVILLIGAVSVLVTSQALKIIVKAVSAYRGREGACRGRKSSCFVFCANNVGALRLL